MYQFFMDEQRIRLLADEDGIDVAMFGTAMLFGITANAKPKVSIKHDRTGEFIEYVDMDGACQRSAGGLSGLSGRGGIVMTKNRIYSPLGGVNVMV